MNGYAYNFANRENLQHKTSKIYDVEGLKTGLSDVASSFCQYLFPRTKQSGNKYCIGWLSGIFECRFRVLICGSQAGRWKNLDTEKRGNDLLGLLCQLRGYGLYFACSEASQFLRHPIRRSMKTGSVDFRNEPLSKPVSAKSYKFSDFSPNLVPNMIIEGGAR